MAGRPFMRTVDVRDGWLGARVGGAGAWADNRSAAGALQVAPAAARVRGPGSGGPGQGTRVQPASSTAAAMSARSTGRSAVTVTVPLARSTVTDRTPSTAEISWVTARWQCAQLIPLTWKVVEPMNVCGVLESMGTPRSWT